MDEPTEPTPALDAGSERPPGEPVPARSTEHPWEEPPLLPAPSMFLGAPAAPTRGRHARRRHPVALVGTAAAAALLLGASAVALIDVAQHGPAGAGAGSGGIAQAAGPGGTTDQNAGGGAGASRGTGKDLVNARSIHRAASGAVSATYDDAPIGAAFAGHSPTAGVPNHVVTTPTAVVSASTGTARATVPSTGRGSGSSSSSSYSSSSSSYSSSSSVPSRAPSSVPSSHEVVPIPPRSTAVPSYVPSVPSTEPTEVPRPAPHSKPPVERPVPHSQPPTEKPVPSVPVSVPPVRTPTGHPAPSPVVSVPDTVPPETVPPHTVPPVTLPPVLPTNTVPVPHPTSTDSGLHRALGHATPAPGLAVGHAKSPANPDATPPAHVPLPPGVRASASPTATLAE